MPAERTQTSRPKARKQRVNPNNGIGGLNGSGSATHPYSAPPTFSASVPRPKPHNPEPRLKRVHFGKPYARPPHTGKRPELIRRKIPKPRPLPLEMADLKFVSKLGNGAFGFVSLVRVMKRDTRKHPLDRPGAQFALKALDKKHQRELEMNEWTERYDTDEEHLKAIKETLDFRDAEREKLTQLPWHPFVCGLVGTFNDDLNYYLLMELAPCESFNGYLEAYGPLSSEDARFYFANLTLALEFLHTHGIVHRDLKPHNLLMGADGYIKVGDFGVSAHVTSPYTWKRIGTFPYAPPEGFREGIDPREMPECARIAGDWWAAAITLYEMVTLTIPFRGGEEHQVYKNILSRPPELYWEEIQDLYIDPDLKDLVGRMLTPDLTKRYGALVVKDEGETLGRNDEVRIHPFLSGKVDWRKMNQRLLVPPYVPEAYPDMSKRVQKRTLGLDEVLPEMAEVHYPVELEFDLWNQTPRESKRADDTRVF
ncbi:kinase-like protein [Daedalea quercina L-15889]|uniref:cAMP-dependent protein kinase n=1 Tax=Daedalea quercina L-15889 TaxID=1314783 RepID=A0A165QPV6_9APHY|nr:kinase-like protein [Daedalea quercina L-15889]